MTPGYPVHFSPASKNSRGRERHGQDEPTDRAAAEDALRRAGMHFGNFNAGGRENVVHRVEQRTVIEVHPDELA